MNEDDELIWYQKEVKPIRLIDERGEVGSYDPTHPEIIAKIATGELKRIDN